jgi:ferredoxin
MPLQPKILESVLHENLTLHTTLCRREAPAFQKALASGEEIVVACTQESRLFNELADETPGAKGVPIRFVNIRETGGWSKDAAQASPKIAALLALAHLPEPEPVTTVTYKSQGRVLIIGNLDVAERAADLLSDSLQVTLFSLGAGQGDVAQERRYPVLAGKIGALSGWLGAFELVWERNNPIDLDLCTRCNACVAACPEGAIGLDFQVNLDKCQSHRACVSACGMAGAIDFSRPSQEMRDAFDIVLDLRATPAFPQHAPPQGYFQWDGLDHRVILKVRSLTGEFEKPKFFNYKQKLCAHSRNEKTGCNACIDVCSASAITSERSRQQINVNPNLCVGCGACTTVCPTGALTFNYPRASEQGVKLKMVLASYAKAGGKQAALLFHSQEKGGQWIGALGRAARVDPAVRGVPARVIPLPLWHTASMGLELWLSAIAYGAANVWVLVSDEEAPQYLDALQSQMDIAQAVLNGLGYEGQHFRVLKVAAAQDLKALDAQLQAKPGQGVAQVAGFAVQSEKRATLELALNHLITHAPLHPEHIPLPAGSPLGALALDRDRCTMCLSCINACPASALQDNALAPQLKFIEKNCVQCGLCVTTCPETALSLVPQLRLTSQRNEAVVINEMQPYACIRCSKPFGTLKAIESMLGKLVGHSMFQGAALERLKMCGDCRVIDLYTDPNEVRITDIK